MTAVIELRNVVREYPGTPPVQALAGVDLRVDEGELVAIVGSSGSGKSTLLNIMGTLDRPTSGTVEIEGCDVSTLGDSRVTAIRARRIGFIFQSYQLLEHMSLAENVEQGLLYQAPRSSKRRDLAMQALDRVGLVERSSARPSALSGGQRQRVAIARALVGEPRVVLADEPTGNLDSKTGAEIVDLFHDLHKQGSTLVIITHDRELAASFPRQVHVRDGLIDHEVSDRGHVVVPGCSIADRATQFEVDLLEWAS